MSTHKKHPLIQDTFLRKKPPDFSPIHISNKDIKLSEWIPSIHRNIEYTHSNDFSWSRTMNASIDNINTHSWFSHLTITNPYSSVPTKVSINVPFKKTNQDQEDESDDEEDNFKSSKKLYKANKIRLYPSDKQKLILRKMFKAYTLMYNATVKYLKNIYFNKGKPNHDMIFLEKLPLITPYPKKFKKLPQAEQNNLIQLRNDQIKLRNEAIARNKPKKVDFQTVRQNMILERDLILEILDYEERINSIRSSMPKPDVDAKQKIINSKVYSKNMRQQIAKRSNSYYNSLEEKKIILTQKREARGKNINNPPKKQCHTKKIINENASIYDDDYNYSFKPTPINTHIMSEAIRKACASFKTSITHMNKGRIKTFRVRDLKVHRRKQIVIFDQECFHNGNICERALGPIKSSKPLCGIKETCTLNYDSLTNKYLLTVPEEIKESVRNNVDNIECGIDLGFRTFATVYSENQCEAICDDPYAIFDNCFKKIQSIQNKLSAKHPKLLNSRNKPRNKYNGRKRSNLKRGLRKYYKRIQDLVKDLHFKSSYTLVNKYLKIYIGKISVKNILRRKSGGKKNSQLSKKNKRICSALSPYSFIERLKYMGKKYGVEIIPVSEYLTTKTCSSCGRKNELGKSKYHICHCGMRTERDINAAKNMIKTKKKFDSLSEDEKNKIAVQKQKMFADRKKKEEEREKKKKERLKERKKRSKIKSKIVQKLDGKNEHQRCARCDTREYSFYYE
jgi:hypothetical protein